MRDAESVMDRIILLDGMPNMQRLGSVRIGETVREQLDLDRDLELAAIERYRRGVLLAHDEGDPGTRDLLSRLVVGEEEHLDWIDTQLTMISDIGIELYTQHQIGD